MEVFRSLSFQGLPVHTATGATLVDFDRICFRSVQKPLLRSSQMSSGASLKLLQPVGFKARDRLVRISMGVHKPPGNIYSDIHLFRWEHRYLGRLEWSILTCCFTVHYFLFWGICVSLIANGFSMDRRATIGCIICV